jgi:DNA-binding MarR family transcriptional regulator
MQATAVDADQDLSRSLVGFMKYLLHTHGRPFFDAIAELDLSLTQVRTLRILCLDRDEISLKELAGVLGLSMPAVSRSVEALVQRGLLTRTEDTEDRRLKQLRATDEARALVDRLLELRFAGLEDFVASLSPRERARLGAALAPIVAREDIARVCGLEPPR